jgi:hypothetical protein
MPINGLFIHLIKLLNYKLLCKGENHKNEERYTVLERCCMIHTFLIEEKMCEARKLANYCDDRFWPHGW